ncbi:hypothetical protein IP69_13730 [Bosea sp. AAP35]|nr:hypothetical protein IP69_13730 [Bosea sp. AAP35]
MITPKRPRGPAQRVARARADAKAADRRLELASRSRLKELMQLAPRERLAHINDVDLIPSDRTRLRRAVQAQLPLKRLRLPRKLSSLSLVSWLGRLDEATFVRGTALSVLFIAFGVAGWWTTATAHILRESEEINFVMPEGWRSQMKIPANTKLATLQRGGVLRTRLWLHGRGYAQTDPYVRSPPR